MLDKSPVIWTRDLTKLAHPAFCSAGTADPVDISSSLLGKATKELGPLQPDFRSGPEGVKHVEVIRRTCFGFRLGVHY